VEGRRLYSGRREGTYDYAESYCRRKAHFIIRKAVPIRGKGRIEEKGTFKADRILCLKFIKKEREEVEARNPDQPADALPKKDARPRKRGASVGESGTKILSQAHQTRVRDSSANDRENLKEKGKKGVGDRRLRQEEGSWKDGALFAEFYSKLERWGK